MLYKPYLVRSDLFTTQNEIFTSDLASLMLYETFLLRSALFTAQKLDFYI